MLPHQKAPLYLRTAASLSRLCAQAQAEGRLALDLEFIRENSYTPRLALIQIAVSDTCAIIDPLEVHDLTPLLELWTSPHTLKILHAAGQDTEVLHWHAGVVPAHIFDTQIAAALVLLVRLPAVLGRILGAAAALTGLASFVPLAAIRAARDGAGGLPQGVLELLLGATLMGAIWLGMILGHWYLVERRLSNRYMVWVSWVNVAAVAAGLGSVLLSMRNPVPCEGLVGAAFEVCARSFSPVLRIGEMTVVLGLGVLALIALIAGFNVRLAKEGGRSIQASAGMFYLAVILAPAVEFAAKVRFF